MDKLLFAQKFPFSKKAKEHLKDSNISVDNIPENAIKKAALMVSRAFSGNVYSINSEAFSKEFLDTEITAFPAAKMFVSVMKAPNIIEKFSLMIYKSTFNYLVENDNAKDLCQELADDFELKYSLSQEKDCFVEVPLEEFLKINFIDEEIKLLNKPLSKGIVYLNVNDFARFLAEKAYVKVFDSLPIKKENVPKTIVELSKSVDSQLVVMEKKTFDLKLAGKIDPNLFPPCMKVLYNDQLAGKKLHYMARLALASFLHKLGMSKQEMLILYSKSPDFKKQIAEYHIDRILASDLSSPGCKKLWDYGLRVSECEKECKFKHPLQWYISKLRIRNQVKNSSLGKSKEVN